MILQAVPIMPSSLDTTIAKPEKGSRLDSISSLSTEATVESSVEDLDEDTCDETSLDEEEGAASQQCAVILEEEDEVCTESNSHSSIPAAVSDLLLSNEEPEEDSEVHADDDDFTTTTPQNPKAPMERKSSLKLVQETIPLKNSGWKNLPKLTIPVQKTYQKQSNASSANTKPKKLVQFGSIEIRSYDICIGDNPSVSYGTPVSLDWTYQLCGQVAVDVYESSKPRQRRNLRQMMMNSYHRRHVLLMHWNATEAECLAAEQQVNRLRNQRGLTKALLPLAPVEDAVTSGWRKLRRAVQGRP